MSSWKYYRTQLWMEYCNPEAALPAPFNLAHLLMRGAAWLCCCCKRGCCCCSEDANDSGKVDEVKRER